MTSAPHGTWKPGPRRAAEPGPRARARPEASPPKRMLLLAVWLVGALLAAPVFWHLSEPFLSDIYLHGRILLQGMESGVFPWYTVFYALLYAASLGQAATYDDLRVQAVVILALAMGAKAAATLWVVGRTRARLWATLLATLFALLVVPLRLSYATWFYLGKITPAIWHNSTTVLLMPISLVLFVVAADVFRRDRAGWQAVAALTALIVADLLVKPNFGMVFLPVFGVWTAVVAIRRRPRPDWWRPLARYGIVALAAVAALGAQYWGTYATGSVDYTNTFDPLTVWSFYTPNIALSVFESLLLPVVATIALWRGARDRASLVLAWSCTLLAVALFALLGEINLATGELLTHGNWSWAMHVAIFVTFVVLIREWLQQSHDLPVESKIIVGLLAAAQAVTGIVYLVNVFLVSYA